MQDQIEVIKFEETPDLKFFGVATVRLHKSVVLRYKVVEKKDASGFFIVPPSYKKSDTEDAKWCAWFMLDSQIFSEEVIEQVNEYVNNWISEKMKETESAGQKQSTFGSANEPHETKDDIPF